MYTVTHCKNTTFFLHIAYFFKIWCKKLNIRLKYIHNEWITSSIFFVTSRNTYLCQIKLTVKTMIRPLNIMLAENDTDLAIITKNYLVNHGYTISICEEKEEALVLFAKEKFDLLIIDSSISKNEGISLALRFRRTNKDVPIILLGTNTTHDDVITTLKMEIDDFLIRPFSIEELYLRIEIIMKRINIGIRNQYLFKIGKYTLDTLHHVLIFNGTAKKLTSKELDLLYLFYQHKNRIVERHLALKKVWNQENYFSARNMDVYIKRLRNMLCEDTDVQIENVHGVGYKLIVYGL